MQEKKPKKTKTVQDLHFCQIYSILFITKAFPACFWQNTTTGKERCTYV